MKNTSGNPAVIGLYGFGLTTFLLNLKNAGVYEGNSMIDAMGLCYGGLAQVIAGIMEWKKGNTFAFVAFTSYGFFWISLILIHVLPALGVSEKPNNMALGFYCFIWGLFTLALFVATLKIAPRALQFTFLTVVVLFWLLAAHFFAESHVLERIAGVEGIICGLSAIYVASGELLNQYYGRTIIPLGELKKKWEF